MLASCNDPGEVANEMSTPEIVRAKLNKDNFATDLSAFDHFLGDIPNSNQQLDSSTGPVVPLSGDALDEGEDEDDASCFSDDSEGEFVADRRLLPPARHHSGDLEKMFTTSNTDTTAKLPDVAPLANLRVEIGSPKIHERKKIVTPTKNRDGLSRSEHGASRRRDDGLAASGHGPRRNREIRSGARRAEKDELAKSEQSARKRNSVNKGTPSPTSEHHQRRSLSRNGHSQMQRSQSGSARPQQSSTTQGQDQENSRNSILPIPPTIGTSRRRGGRRDELSQSEHGRTRLRRNELYSHTRNSSSKTELDRANCPRVNSEADFRAASAAALRRRTVGGLSGSTSNRRRSERQSRTSTIASSPVKGGRRISGSHRPTSSTSDIDLTQTSAHGMSRPRSSGGGMNRAATGSTTFSGSASYHDMQGMYSSGGRDRSKIRLNSGPKSSGGGARSVLKYKDGKKKKNDIDDLVLNRKRESTPDFPVEEHSNAAWNSATSDDSFCSDGFFDSS